MPFLEARLVLHVRADSLNWREITQVSVPGKCGCKRAFGTVEELWVGQLVIGLLGAYKRSCRPRIHQLLTEIAHLALGLANILLFVHLVNVLIVKVALI